MFTRRITAQATAFGLSAVLTVAMLAGMDSLATQQHAGTELAQNQAVQQVVVVGQRMPRS